MYALIFSASFSLASWLVVAVKPCMVWIPIKKKKIVIEWDRIVIEWDSKAFVNLEKGVPKWTLWRKIKASGYCYFLSVHRTWATGVVHLSHKQSVGC